MARGLGGLGPATPGGDHARVFTALLRQLTPTNLKRDPITDSPASLYQRGASLTPWLTNHAKSLGLRPGLDQLRSLTQALVFCAQAMVDKSLAVAVAHTLVRTHTTSTAQKGAEAYRREGLGGMDGRSAKRLRRLASLGLLLNDMGLAPGAGELLGLESAFLGGDEDYSGEGGAGAEHSSRRKTPHKPIAGDEDADIKSDDMLDYLHSLLGGAGGRDPGWAELNRMPSREGIKNLLVPFSFTWGDCPFEGFFRLCLDVSQGALKRLTADFDAAGRAYLLLLDAKICRLGRDGGWSGREIDTAGGPSWLSGRNLELFEVEDPRCLDWAALIGRGREYPGQAGLDG